MVNEVNKVITTKKEDMMAKRQGSVIFSEPKIIWMNIWDIPTSDKVFTLRGKFNVILDETLSNYKNCYLLEFKPSITHFDRANNFNNTGRNAFWRFVDQQVMKFDKQQITLKPKKGNNRGQ